MYVNIISCFTIGNCVDKGIPTKKVSPYFDDLVTQNGKAVEAYLFVKDKTKYKLPGHMIPCALVDGLPFIQHPFTRRIGNLTLISIGTKEGVLNPKTVIQYDDFIIKVTPTLETMTDVLFDTVTIERIAK